MKHALHYLLAAVASVTLTGLAFAQEAGDKKGRNSYQIPAKNFEMFGNQTTDEEMIALAEKSGMLETGKPVTELEGKPQIRLVRAKTPAVLPVFGVKPNAENIEVVALEDNNSVVLGKASKISDNTFSFTFEKNGVYQLMVRTDNKVSRMFKLKVIPEDSPFLYMPSQIHLSRGQEVTIVGDNFTEESKFFFGATKVASTYESETLIKAVVPDDAANGVIRVWNPGRKHSNGIMYYLKKDKSS